jgi:hypothetical protein
VQFAELTLGTSISAEALLRIIEKTIVFSCVAGSVSYNREEKRILRTDTRDWAEFSHQ